MTSEQLDKIRKNVDFNDVSIHDVIPLLAEVERLKNELALAVQVSGELCEKCGWAMRFPQEPCRCELLAEVERLQKKVSDEHNRAMTYMNDLMGANHENERLRAERDAAYQRGAEAMREAAAGWFVNDIEHASAEAHTAYQVEAHRRGDVRHADAYEDLSEATKEWDRVLCRWAASAVRALPLPQEK